MRPDEVEQAGECGSKCAEKLIGRRMLMPEFLKDLTRSLVWLKLFGNFGEVLLVAMQVGVADFEKLRQWNVDHFVILQFL